jgi:hypothetical protein
MAEFSDYVEQAGRRYVGALSGAELMAGSRGGVSKSWTTQQIADLAFGNIVEGDVPTGDIDGVNDTFALTYNPLAASVKVYHNGLRTSAFTVDGQNIIMTVPPEIGDTLLSDYRV